MTAGAFDHHCMIIAMIRGLAEALARADRVGLRACTTRTSLYWRIFPPLFQSVNISLLFISIIRCYGPINSAVTGREWYSICRVSTKLLSQCYELYISTSGKLQAEEELELITSDLSGLINKI